ncbi:hypothetical protein KUTeg_024569 [Tegillarca granosa]|uniref:WD repeat-containing protein 17 n=1 Tax=Tegillarca granosa TaxID=220873 RepID=A0ABQ9DXR8_TEGGR|nr:hypothetical protein KUTeg_024569 [Tegillarca granosa]
MKVLYILYPGLLVISTALWQGLIKMHGKSSVFSVAWNQKDSKRIMSVGADNYCIVRLVNGEIFQKYKHPATVYGCDWSPNNKDMLATGCEDKCVRVYYLAASSDQPLKIFTGHTSKVFHVRWSPLRDGILCSGSDDGTIRVWDYTQDACVTVLKGHEGPVRGLLWNFEVPYLLISGSWDYTIRIWDTRDGACVDTLLDHGADVYGLTCHPLRPFLLASCSRDSTVRLWSLSSLVQPIEMNVIAGKPWTDIIGTTESAMALGNPPLLAGKTSKDLRQWLESSSSNSKARTLEHVSKFFSQPVGTDNLWELVSVVKGIDDTLLSQNYSQGIMHVKHLTKYKSSEAQELEMVKMSRLGIHSKEDKLREAAKLHIKLGNIQRYCEIMVELGEWLKALSVAPAVSMEYWKSLTRRYATYLAREDSDDVSIYSSAIGDVEQLTDFYTSQGQLLDAVVSAQVACEGAFSQQQYSESSSDGLCNGDNLPTKLHKKLLEKSVNNLAEWYFDNGSPIMSACCYLSISNNQKALWKLIQGQELELAVAIGTVLGNTPVQTYKAIEYLSRRCEHLGKWELAVDLLMLIPDNDILLAQCCSRCAASLDEINFLHERAGLPSLEDCFNEAEKLRTKINRVECIKFYLLGPTPETGLELGVQEIKKKLSTADWTVDDVFPLIQLISSIRSDRFLQHKLEQLVFIINFKTYLLN